MNHIDYEAIFQAMQDIIKEDNLRSNMTGRFFDPATEFAGAIKDVKELQARLGRKYKNDVSSLLTLIEAISPYIKNIQKYGYTSNKTHIQNEAKAEEFALSSYNRLLVSKLGSHDSVNRTIQKACKIGLLKCTNSFYSSLGYTKEQNKSRCYIANPKVVKLIQDFALERGLKQFVKWVKQEDDDLLKFIQDINNNGYTSNKTHIRENEIKVSSRLNLPAEITDDEVIAALLLRYPWLKEDFKLVDELNATVLKAYPELQIVYKPTIHRGKKGRISSIGLRLSSQVCSFKSRKKEQQREQAGLPVCKGGVYREDYLRDFFHGADVIEYDVKASIYQISKWLRTGKWIGNSVDLYPLMSGQVLNATQRNAFKLFAMFLYFGGSPRLIKHRLKLKGIDLSLDALTEAQSRMFGIIGKSIDTEVFVYESSLYLRLFADLVKSGKRIVQVYDGFYSQEQSFSADCQARLKRLADDFYREYVSNR